MDQASKNETREELGLDDANQAEIALPPKKKTRGNTEEPSSKKKMRVVKQDASSSANSHGTFRKELEKSKHKSLPETNADSYQLKDTMKTIGDVGQVKFLQKLMDLLQQEVAIDTLCWASGGAEFVIEPEPFQRKVLNIHFQCIQYDSFERSLRRWGFERRPGEGRYNKLVFFQHTLFRKDSPELIKRIVRQKDMGSNMEDKVRQTEVATNAVSRRILQGRTLPAMASHSDDLMGQTIKRQREQTLLIGTNLTHNHQHQQIQHHDQKQKQQQQWQQQQQLQLCLRHLEQLKEFQQIQQIQQQLQLQQQELQWQWQQQMQQWQHQKNQQQQQQQHPHFLQQEFQSLVTSETNLNKNITLLSNGQSVPQYNLGQTSSHMAARDLTQQQNVQEIPAESGVYNNITPALLQGGIHSTHPTLGTPDLSLLGMSEPEEISDTTEAESEQRKEDEPKRRNSV